MGPKEGEDQRTALIKQPWAELRRSEAGAFRVAVLVHPSGSRGVDTPLPININHGLQPGDVVAIHCSVFPFAMLSAVCEERAQQYVLVPSPTRPPLDNSAVCR